VARIIAVANQKGGVGKTTTSVNLSAALAIQGKSVVLIDLDPQGNATSGLGVDSAGLKHSVYDCLLRGTSVTEVLQSTAVAGLQILPSNADLAGAEVELVSIPERETLLRQVIQSLSQATAAPPEFVIVDCPPALGLLTINALTAVSSVLIPVQCEYYAMEGLGRLLSNVKRIQESLNPALDIEGILSHFKDKVYRSVIPRNVTLAEAPSYGQPVMTYNAASTGAQAYLDLAKELLDHGKTRAR
jgi:chromosome partitioning protein